MIKSRRDIILHEARLLFNLAASTLVLEIGATFAPALIASRVGTQLGKVALSALSLSTVVGNMLCASILTGILSASDTLSPQAFGCGNEREVGLIAVRAFFAVMIIVTPIQICTYIGMKPLLTLLGEDESSIELAFQWYSIYLLSVPFYLLYQIIWKFLAAQEIMAPLTWVTAIATFGFLPLTLELCLSTMGFIGSSIANVIYQIVQVTMLIVYLKVAQPYYKKTWPGLSAWREAISWQPFWSFLILGLGGILTVTEWWFWESIFLVVGSMGIVSLNVHTIAATAIMVTFQIPVGIGAALNVRLGANISKNISLSKHLVLGTYLVTAILMSILCFFMYFFRFMIYSLFTTDEAVIEGCEELWVTVTATFLTLAIFSICMCVMNGLGLQWTGGPVLLIFLWGFTLPAIYYYSIVKEGGINSVWKVMFHSYALLDVMFIYYYATTDWYKISERVNKELGVNDVTNETEKSNLYGSFENESSSAISLV